MALALLLCGVVSFAQDDDESEIEIGGKPEPADEPPKADPKTKPKPQDANKPRAPTQPGAPGPARAPDAKVEWVDFVSADKSVTLGVPSDWQLEETSKAQGVLTFTVLLPGAKSGVALRIQSVPGMEPPGARARSELHWEQTRNSRRGRVVLDPVPYAEVEFGGSRPEFQILLPWRVGSNSFLVAFQCFPPDHELVARDLKGFAERLRTSLPDWPPIPKDYEREEKGSFVFAVHPNARKEARDLQKLIRDVERDFRKFHGKAPSNRPAPVIYVHRIHADGLALEPDLKDAKGICWADWSGQRMYVRAAALDQRKDRSEIAHSTARLCFVHWYGTVYPRWAMIGEGTVAGMLAYGDDIRPPALHQGYMGWIDTSPIVPLDKFAYADWQDMEESHSRAAAFYVHFFHFGSSKFRRAYRDFLEDCGRGVDPPAALEKHMAPIGLDKLRQECDDFRNKKVEYVLPR